MTRLMGCFQRERDERRTHQKRKQGSGCEDSSIEATVQAKGSRIRAKAQPRFNGGTHKGPGMSSPPRGREDPDLQDRDVQGLATGGQ